MIGAGVVQFGGLSPLVSGNIILVHAIVALLVHFCTAAANE